MLLNSFRDPLTILQGYSKIPPNHGHRRNNYDSPNALHLLQPSHRSHQPRPPRRSRHPRLALSRPTPKRNLLRGHLHRRRSLLLDRPTRQRRLRCRFRQRCVLPHHVISKHVRHFHRPPNHRLQRPRAPNLTNMGRLRPLGQPHEQCHRSSHHNGKLHPPHQR